jgi:enoyl-CoA hydratase/carnithine racemase
VSHPAIRVERADAVLTVTIDRPERRNAMTLGMYQAVHEACELADAEPGLRALVLRGGEDGSFSTGTDVALFREFRDGSDGIAYERAITRVVRRLEDVDVPTVAVVQGWCLGGGLLLAAACDLRIGTPAARFGVPVARTLGNCLSADSLSLLHDRVGAARATDLLLRGRVLTGEEGAAAGLLTEICPDDRIDAIVAEVVTELVTAAPLTQWAAKELTRRLRRHQVPPDDDVVGRVYGSADFREAVRAFGDKQPRTWHGR